MPDYLIPINNMYFLCEEGLCNHEWAMYVLSA